MFCCSGLVSSSYPVLFGHLVPACACLSLPVSVPTLHEHFTKVADLEKAVVLRNKAVAAASRSPASPPPAAADIAHRTKGTPTTALPVWSRQGDTAGPDPALWNLASGHEAAGLTQMLKSPWASSAASLLTPPSTGRGVGETGAGGSGGGVGWCPLRVRLRTRLGKRCRKDLAAGRTGILIKATFNPLEGDSSTAKASIFFFFFVVSFATRRTAFCCRDWLVLVVAQTPDLPCAKCVLVVPRCLFLALRPRQQSLFLRISRFFEARKEQPRYVV